MREPIASAEEALDAFQVRGQVGVPLLDTPRDDAAFLVRHRGDSGGEPGRVRAHLSPVPDRGGVATRLHLEAPGRTHFVVEVEHLPDPATPVFYLTDNGFRRPL